MGLIREPKNVDFTVKSKPWTEEELRDFRKLMVDIKVKKGKARKTVTKTKSNTKLSSKKKQLV
ncbi:MAG: hypothetical protein K9H61_12030 [Bacteroidia bacterium]|nr:hypothetical protein [Bacteroidia bacterium]MCF8447715.1 hypothetical protein [Bacteroidia bacterium]